MTQYIDKDVLVAEIMKRRDTALTRQHNLESIGQETVLNEMIAFELNKIISLINTFEVKEVDEQKERLTWEDIPKLLSISEQLKTNCWFRDRTKEIGTQVFWEEVLKRFKAQKGE